MNAPEIEEYRRVYRDVYGKEPPDIKRRSNNTFVIRTDRGDGYWTARELRLVTKKMRDWKHEQT